MSIPYEDAVSGHKALTEAERILSKFGCSVFGTMTDAERGVTIGALTEAERFYIARFSPIFNKTGEHARLARVSDAQGTDEPLPDES